MSLTDRPGDGPSGQATDGLLENQALGARFSEAVADMRRDEPN